MGQKRKIQKSITSRISKRRIDEPTKDSKTERIPRLPGSTYKKDIKKRKVREEWRDDLDEEYPIHLPRNRHNIFDEW